MKVYRPAPPEDVVTTTALEALARHDDPQTAPTDRGEPELNRYVIDRGPVREVGRCGGCGAWSVAALCGRCAAPWGRR